MTDLGASSPAREAGHQARDRAVTRLLRRLAGAYPAFRVSHEVGQKGGRWVAERKDLMAPGVPVVITASLMELHFALAGDGASYATVRHRPKRSRRAARRRARAGARP